MEKDGETEAIRTVTVVGTQAAADPSGIAALALYTRELGAIAFQVDLGSNLGASEEFNRTRTTSSSPYRSRLKVLSLPPPQWRNAAIYTRWVRPACTVH